MKTMTTPSTPTPAERKFHLPPVGTFGPFIALLIACTFFAFQSDRFLSGENLSLILQQVAVVGVIAIGQTLVILTAGIDLSCGMVMALGSIVMTKFATDLGLPPGIAICCGLAVTMLFGLVNGLLVTRLGLPPFIVTLGTLNIAFAITQLYSSSQTVTDLPDALTWLGNTFGLGGTNVAYGTVLMLMLYGVEVLGLPGVGVAHAGAGHRQQRGQAVEQAGQHVDAQQHAVRGDAGEACGLGVVAHCVHVPARGRLAQPEPRDAVQHEHQHRAVGHVGAAESEGVAEPGEGVGQVGDGLRTGVQLRDGKRDVQRAQRHDERRQAEPRDQQPVDEAEQHRHRQAAADRDGRRQAEVRRELGHHDAAEGHHHAARQVDAAGEDHERLPDRDHTHHRHLLEDQGQVLAAQETVGLEGEERARDQQRDERAEGAHRRKVELPFGGGRRGGGGHGVHVDQVRGVTSCPSRGPCRSWCPCCRCRPPGSSRSA